MLRNITLHHSNFGPRWAIDGWILPAAGAVLLPDGGAPACTMLVGLRFGAQFGIPAGLVAGQFHERGSSPNG